MIGESLAYIIIFWAPAKAAFAKTANSCNAVVSAKNQVIFSSILEMFTNALKVFSNTTIVQGGILDYNIVPVNRNISPISVFGKK